MPLARPARRSHAILLTALAGTPLTLADTWDNTAGNAQWSTATNWADNTEPTSTDAVIFPSTVPLNQATILMTTTEFCSTLAFNNDYTLQGGQMFIINGGVSVAGGRTVTINTVINGSAGLAKTGFGTLRLIPTSSNAFSGPITITGLNSTLYVRSNVALGNTANDIEINAGRLQLDGVTNPNFLITGRTITPGSSGGTIELLNNAFLDLNQPLGANANPLTFTGNGTVELNSTSARTGSTFVSVPLLRLNNARGLGTPGSVSLSNGAVLEINNNEGFIFTGTVFPAAGTTIRGGTGTHTFDGFANVAGPMTLNGGLTSSDTLILGSNGASVWNNGSGATTIGVGTVRLASANNYVGDWAISGTLHVDHPNALGTGTTPIIVNPSGRLRLNIPSLVRDITLNNPGGGIEILQDTTVSGRIPIAPNAGFVPILGANHEFTLTGANSSMTSTGTAFFGGAIGVRSMRVFAGADVTGTSTRVFGNASGPARLTLNGAGSTWQNTGEMWFGNAGNPGTLIVEAGGSLSCPRVYVGQGGDAAATLTGPGSSLTSTDLLEVGFAGVVGSLSILDDADVVAGNTRVGELTGASGTVTVSGAGSTLSTQPLSLGLSATGALSVTNGGHVTCQALVLGDGAAASGTVTISGALSGLECNSGPVFMSLNGAASTLNLNGGIVDIHGDITDAGAGTSTLILDAATLDMHNFAIGAGPSPIDNLQFRSGTLKNVAQINNGTGLTKTGPDVLYLNTPNTYTGPTVVTQGTLFVANSTGSATGTGLVSVSADATLAGPGQIGGLVQNDGIVAPEGFVGSPVGTLTVQGTFSQFATGALRIDIASATSHDRLVVTGGGAAVAAGSLDVQLLSGFVPDPGDSFTILTAAFISGQFPTTNLPVLSDGLAWQVNYFADRVVLAVASTCITDVDDGSGTGTPDGGVTIDDLLYYLFSFESGSLDADIDDGSFSGTLDGGVTIDDLLYFLFRFESGC